MNKFNYCRNCGKRLDGGRYDRAYCDDRCAAAYHRRGTPEDAHSYKQPGDVHQEKDRDFANQCENCGNFFAFNEYAKRGGKREAKFCSNKCRQAAFRKRKKGDAEQQQQQQQRAEQQQRGGNQQQRGGNQQQQQQQRAKPSFWDILGVSTNATWSEITAAWKKLVFQHHPDRNMGDQAAANERMKDINQAYQELKKYYGKGTRQTRV